MQPADRNERNSIANDLSSSNQSHTPRLESSQSSPSNIALLGNNRDALRQNTVLPDVLPQQLQRNSQEQAISDEVTNLLLQVCFHHKMHVNLEHILTTMLIHAVMVTKSFSLSLHSLCLLPSSSPWNFLSLLNWF